MGQFELVAPVTFGDPGQDRRANPKQDPGDHSDDEGYYDLANDDANNQADNQANRPATPNRRWAAIALFTHGGESIAGGDVNTVKILPSCVKIALFHLFLL